MGLWGPDCRGLSGALSRFPLFHSSCPRTQVSPHSCFCLWLLCSPLSRPPPLKLGELRSQAAPGPPLAGPHSRTRVSRVADRLVLRSPSPLVHPVHGSISRRCPQGPFVPQNCSQQCSAPANALFKKGGAGSSFRRSKAQAQHKLRWHEAWLRTSAVSTCPWTSPPLPRVSLPPPQWPQGLIVLSPTLERQGLSPRMGPTISAPSSTGHPFCPCPWGLAGHSALTDPAPHPCPRTGQAPLSQGPVSQSLFPGNPKQDKICSEMPLRLQSQPCRPLPRSHPSVSPRDSITAGRAGTRNPALPTCKLG